MAVAAASRADRAQLGIAMVLGGYLFFSCIDTSVKWLAMAGLPALQLAFFRYAGAFAISLAAIARGGLGDGRLGTARPGLVVLRALLLAVGTVMNFYALRFLPLTVTSAIMFSAPLIVCALSVPVLGERVGPWRWGAIALGFAGVLVIVRPFGAEFTWVTLLPVFNATAFATYSLLTRLLSGSVAAETMQLYTGGVGAVLLLPFAIFGWTPPATPLDWALMLGLGLWGWAGHELFSRAHGFAAPSVLMPFTYSFLIYLTLAQYLIWGDLPDRWTVIGAVVVVGAGVVVWWRERHEGRRRVPLVRA